LGIWPLIMGITMFIQMRLNPTPPDPTQRIIFTWMPLIFTFMLRSFPAGLVMYWAWTNTLSVLQQYTIMKRSGADVNLWGNIVGTFSAKRRAAAAALASGKSGAAPAALPAPANDDAPAARPGKKKQRGAKGGKPREADASAGGGC